LWTSLPFGFIGRSPISPQPRGGGGYLGIVMLSVLPVVDSVPLVNVKFQERRCVQRNLVDRV
jgi:hypothetical protein